MKKYINPQIEIIKLAADDIITCSDVDTMKEGDEVGIMSMKYDGQRTDY